jgi:aryl-alcohol dehydrogenase-like predicted oxidoreductase
VKFAKLGRTGVTVSKIALGTATLGVAPSAETADAVINRAIDLGINVFDCANSYGNQPRFDRPGAAPPARERAFAEEILGKTLGARRKEVILCSKVMEPVGQGVNDRGLSRRHIFSEVEASLRRLNTDHLDLYYAHHPDPDTPLEETLRAFDDLVRAGKILYPALSTYPATLVVEALWICDRMGLHAPVIDQIPYSLAMRSVERDIIPVCARHGVSVAAFSPLAGGLLAGEEVQRREFSGRRRWGGPGFSEDQIHLATQLQSVANESGIPSAALALNWLLAQPAVATAIVGPESVAELEASAFAIDVVVPDEVLDAVDRIDKPPLSPWGR